MLNYVSPFMVNLVMNGWNWLDGPSRGMFIRTIYVGWFKYLVYSKWQHKSRCKNLILIFSSHWPRITVTSSRRTTLYRRSKRFSTTYFCRCSRQQIIPNNIQNCTVSCNMSSVSIPSTTNLNRKIHYLSVMWIHRNNGPTRIIHRTRTTFTTCTPIWRCWITSAKSVAWIHSCCVHIVAKQVPCSIWYAVFWCLRIFRMDCCCVKCRCCSICTIWPKLVSQCHHFQIIRCSWTIIEIRCPSIWRVDYAFRSVQTIHCNSISQK